MDQSRPTVSWPQFCRLCRAGYSLRRLNVWANLNPATEPIRPTVLDRRHRKLSVWDSLHATTMRTADNRADGFYPSVDQRPQRDFISLPNRPGVVGFD